MDRNFALSSGQKKPLLNPSQVTQLAQATKAMASTLPSRGRESQIRDMSLHANKEMQAEQEETRASAESVNYAMDLLIKMMQ